MRVRPIRMLEMRIRWVFRVLFPQKSREGHVLLKKGILVHHPNTITIIIIYLFLHFFKVKGL